MKTRILFICFVVLSMTSCVSTRLKNNNEPDRGKIEILDPMMPPSLTNEWEEINIYLNTTSTTNLDTWKITETNGHIKVIIMNGLF